MKNNSLSCGLAFMALLLFVNVLTSCKKDKKGDIPPTATIDSLKIGLIAYYPFNNSGADSSGKMNDVAYYANITPTTDRFSKANSAFYFDGFSSYLKIKDNQSLRLNNTDYTISAWVKLDAFNSTFSSAIISKRNAGLNLGYYLGINGTGGAARGSIGFGPGGGLPGLTSVGVISANSWQMITVVYNLAKQQASVYKNGVFDSSVLNISSPNGTQTADIYIGTDNPGTGTYYFLKGAIDDMRIYNRILTAKEIQKLYTAVN